MTFSLHFSLLTIAVGLVAVMSFEAPWMLDPYAYVTFAMSGLLHAVSVAGAVRVERRWGLRIGFVVGAGILSCLAPQAGIFVSQLAGIGSFLGLIACISAIGALLYALLIKAYWLRTLSLIAVVGIATVCAVTSSIVLILAGSSIHLQAALISCWWIAFSVALCAFARTRARHVPIS